MDSMDIVASKVDKLQGQNEESAMKLTDLNDDCLIHFFSLLSNNDLVNLCAASVRFNDAYRTVFSKRKNKWMDFLSAFRTNWIAEESFTLTKNIFDRFGDLILSTCLHWSIFFCSGNWTQFI